MHETVLSGFFLLSDSKVFVLSFIRDKTNNLDALYKNKDGYICNSFGCLWPEKAFEKNKNLKI
ncbi:hypothetical protein [uncultured Flavobacterium sp.]|uniref:hypothetical protein n=1 Tax=uncultured Flavobacterium sp. TaxID=165435 RepID=UPI0025E07CAE|nr:hypothetical protein [uncultured Flavobacterium sp.]